MQLLVHRISEQTRLTPKPTLRQILASRVLALPAHELRQAVQTELSQNPALELAEEGRCPRCDSALAGGSCPVCRLRLSEPVHVGPAGVRAPTGRGAALPDVDSLPAPEDERALLKLDLAASADGQEEASPAAFLEWVGADGRLAAPLEEVARNLGATQAEAEMAIRRVRDLAPPGFAAQDLRECLCLQAEALALSGGEEAATARQILTRHWQSFVRGHYRKIARSLGVDGKQVARAADFIRSRFAAYPGGVASASPAVEPDVSVAVCDGQLKIEVLGPVPEQLCISPPWEQAARNPRLEQRQRASVRSLLDRAALFIQGIGFRARTLGALTAALAEAEKPFFAAALAHPVPLKREEVARRAGLHPSTARRALSQKNLLLPDGRTVPFEIFFDASLPAKRELRRILLAETSSRRLSDSALAEVLRGQGLTVARRTVAKYRREMGLDSHHRTGQDERG